MQVRELFKRLDSWCGGRFMVTHWNRAAGVGVC